jgi:hypothetical protein
LNGREKRAWSLLPRIRFKDLKLTLLRVSFLQSFV